MFFCFILVVCKCRGSGFLSSKYVFHQVVAIAEIVWFLSRLVYCCCCIGFRSTTFSFLLWFSFSPQQWMMQNLLMDHSQHGFQQAAWVQLLRKIWTTIYKSAILSDCCSKRGPAAAATACGLLLTQGCVGWVAAATGD